MKPRRGRPPKLEPEVIDKLCQALAAGNFRNVAAEWAGIGVTTLRDWMRRGKEQRTGKFRDFRRRVLEAEKAAEIRAVGLVMAAAKDDAKHAEWWLERKFNERWGRKDTTKLTGGKEPIKVEARRIEEILTEEQLIALAKQPDAPDADGA